MPSIHVAMPTLFALTAGQAPVVAGRALAAFAVVIFLGSVMLGWHYADRRLRRRGGRGRHLVVVRPMSGPYVLTRRQRAAIAAVAGGLMALLTYRAYGLAPPMQSDFDFVWIGLRAFVHGQNPYQVVADAQRPRPALLSAARARRPGAAGLGLGGRGADRLRRSGLRGAGLCGRRTAGRPVRGAAQRQRHHRRRGRPVVAAAHRGRGRAVAGRALGLQAGDRAGALVRLSVALDHLRRARPRPAQLPDHAELAGRVAQGAGEPGARAAAAASRRVPAAGRPAPLAPSGGPAARGALRDAARDHAVRDRAALPGGEEPPPGLSAAGPELRGGGGPGDRAARRLAAGAGRGPVAGPAAAALPARAGHGDAATERVAGGRAAVGGPAGPART